MYYNDDAAGYSFKKKTVRSNIMVMRVVMLVLLLSEVVEGWSMAVASGSGMGGGPL